MTAKEIEDKNASQTLGAKAWCLDNAVTIQQVEKAWDNALKANNMIIKNLDSHGQSWHNLPDHLLKQLIERYSK